MLTRLNSGTLAFYYSKAPLTVKPPFGIIDFNNGSDDYTFTDNGLESTYQIKVISDQTFPFEAASLYADVHTLIQDAPLTFSDFYLMQCRRTSPIQYQDPQGFWHIGGIYEIDIRRN